MNILICNERMLARFGVDRILFIIGASLVEAGHRVSLVALRGDRAAAAAVGPLHLIDLPGGLDIAGAERHATAWLDAQWGALFEQGVPDLVLTGGWPFFGVAAFSETQGVPSVFIDAGAVPHDGFPDGVLPSQRELRRMRAIWLPAFTAVLPISAFIRSTQTIADRGHADGVTTILLGANHLEQPMFQGAAAADSEAALLAECRAAIQAGSRFILGLGRYEGQGYKNSPALLSVFQRVRQAGVDAKLLLLATADEVDAPEHLRPDIVPLGYVSDACLAELTRLSSLSLSTSLWEGFNLPLAESQWFSVPCLAFACGAHAEVTAHPWFLCNSVSEMAEKAVLLITGAAPADVTAEPVFDRFRAAFDWSHALGHYRRTIEAIGTSARLAKSGRPREQRPLMLIDCTNSSVDPANPGVIRVARRLSRCLQQAGQFIMIFMRWDKARREYITLYNEQTLILSRYNGPKDHVSQQVGEACSIDQVLAMLPDHSQKFCFFPEVVLDGHFPERILWARVRGFTIAAILYDMIPISHAPLCSRDVVVNFPEYIQTIASLDIVLAISHATRAAYLEHCARAGLTSGGMCEAVWLPAQFSDSQRRRAEPVDTSESVLAVCVASLDPRKNHRTLIEAFRMLRERDPTSRLRLTLVGNRFGSADLLADWVMQQVREVEGLEWTGLVTDQEIESLMARAAFTVYPSIVEGFGLPIVESLWMGRPCLCHSSGVMSELASPGGCLTVDMHDPAALADALHRLETDAALRARLSDEITGRPLADWTSYAAAITASFAQYAGMPFDRGPEDPAGRAGTAGAARGGAGPQGADRAAAGGAALPLAMNDHLSSLVADVERNVG